MKGFLKVPGWTAIVVGLCVSFYSCSSNKREGDPHVLVFSKTAGFKHSSIPTGIAAIQKLGAENGFAVDTTKNAAVFASDSLSKYSAIIFLSTTGDVLNATEEAGFERYIQSGGGFVGIHAATDTEYNWGWYGKLVGGYFQSHPPGTQEARFDIVDKNHPASSFFTEDAWIRTDELYNFKNLNPDVNVLITIDESTYEGGENGDYHPMSWYHEYDGGRAFYTALGHTDETFSEELFLSHLMGGIQYAIGENLKLDNSQASSQYPPEGDRFSKVVFTEGEFFEPIEMAILPNNDILIGQRRGEILRYDRENDELTQVGFLDVYHQSGVPGVNAEEGLMGLQKDPDFENNNWIYVYYSPKGDEWINRLSRFKYLNGAIQNDTEQVILTVETQRQICCHTGGSIAFGPDNMLYLSTGDNSTPFNEPDAKYVNNGFAPLNDLPGKQQYDARRTSGNTNDLRGKILRIKVNEDGSYDIPEGNLFPVGTENTRPEIYTMGHRNPYRIAVDVRRGYLYWGDVGPDSRADSMDTRGPRGYDEINQARTAGNYGWPLFIGNNRPYREYNYETGESGEFFDPAKPVNNSRNNTGLTELPPANAPLIWYDYEASSEFHGLASGGRNAMAGPTYYSDMYEGDNVLPSYYDGKVIVYDWMRGWMKAIHLFPNGEMNKYEAFAPDIKFNNLIDLEVGPDGTIYTLEYGSGWFSQNADSRLGYIAYNGGNRPPVIEDLIVDKSSGIAPLTMNLKAQAYDPDKGDEIKYVWRFGDGSTETTETPEISHTFSDNGEYAVSLEVVDGDNASVVSSPIQAVVGNTAPEVTITVDGNSSFYIPGKPFAYTVSVNDAEDGSDIDPERLFVTVDYLESFDEASMTLGHQQASAETIGKEIMEGLDCIACHKEAEKSIGPSYVDVAAKYRGDQEAMNYLTGKIISGGTGVWGEVMMPAHPDLSQEEARQITRYILSLGEETQEVVSLPASGTVTPEQQQGSPLLVMRATYRDEGANDLTPLASTASLVMKPNQVGFANQVTTEGFNQMSFGTMDLLLLPKPGGWFMLKDIDLNGVSSAMVMAGWQAPPSKGVTLEVRAGAPDGTLLGTGTMPAPGAGQQGGAVMIQFNENAAGYHEELYFVYSPEPEERLGAEDNMAFFSVTFN